MTLQQIFVGRKTKSELIGLFLATLELVRQKQVRVCQNKPGEEITLELIDESEQAGVVPNNDSPADWRDPQTGEVQYDWPDPAAKERAEKRARMRSERLAKKEFEQLHQDSDEDRFDVDQFQFEDDDITPDEKDSSDG